MAEITRALGPDDLTGLDALLREYLDWNIGHLADTAGRALDPGDYVGRTLAEMDSYLGETGRLYLVHEGVELAGMGFLKSLDTERGEIKRLYVRPTLRGQGLGRRVLSHLIADARQIGYRQLLLDSTVFMAEAQALYRAEGFVETAPYPEAETSRDLADHMVYMALDLD